MGNVVRLADRDRYRREGYRIVISPGLWRGFEVTIEPTTSTHPLRAFRTYGKAMGCALAIQGAEGWPLFSNCGGDGPGGRVA